MEQAPNNKTPELLDTTDCLEAIDSIRSMKNFLFVIILLCLLVTGTVFCLDRTDYIDRTDCQVCSVCPAGSCASVCAAAKQPSTPAAAAESVTLTVRQPVEPSSQEAQIPSDPNAKTYSQLTSILHFKPSCRNVTLALKVCNFILVLTAAMYCLTLLMSLKISIAGRLGGISHISRAFFISLFALVILLPWQALFPGVVVGAIFLPAELLCQWHIKAQNSVFWLIMCYLRFAGLWLVVLLMFTLAQMRSRKWAKATLRRLGLVR